ncbi:MAG TPA: aldo/keto reductase [Candidatus Binatia bacterium]|nr:aldo/keto reductase [Candidatus Binatia bacterium]
MEVTRTAYGTWSGGRFMHFGEPLPEDRYLNVIRLAYERGIRTFMTADVYGDGQADELLGRALEGIARESYCLVGAVGHDFYEGKREGAKGYPRFTNLSLRGPDQYASYLRMATEKSLARCRAQKFDLLLLHNPDWTGYSSEAVWKGMEALKSAGLTDRVGIAPGPANGFTLDVIYSFEKFGSLIDWAMLILNPLEPWPGTLALPAAKKHDVQVITRVVDYGGLFHDDVKPGHKFLAQDHRVFRPQGWVEAGNDKLEQIRAITKAHNLTLLQLACIWNLSQPAVRSVIPTFIQENGPGAKAIEAKIEELATLPDVRLSDKEMNFIAAVGNNRGCMTLKGGNPEHEGEAAADRWPLSADLAEVGKRWNINPGQDLVCTHH